MTFIANVAAGGVITSTWGNSIRDQGITPVADGAGVGAIAIPVEGQYVYLEDVNQLRYWNGVDWTHQAGTAIDSLAITTVGTYYSGTAEALVTSASVSGYLISGERYGIHCSVPVTSSAAGDVVSLKLRHTNLAGTEIAFTQHYIPGAGYTEKHEFLGEYTATSTAAVSFVLTAMRSGGTGTVTVATTGISRFVGMILYHLAQGPVVRTV